MEDFSQYRAQFVTAAKSRIVTLQQQLGEIRNDLSNQTMLHEIHINAHSLRGEAYAVGYKQLGDLIEVLENYVQHLIQTQKSFPIEKFPAFSYTVAMVVSTVERLEHQPELPELADVIRTAQEQLHVTSL